MKILVSFMSKQTVIQASVIEEASPDFILFFTTPKAAEEQWFKNIPIIIGQLQNKTLPYRNVFIERDISMSLLVQTVKKHVHEILSKNKVSDIILDASSGKGIHRIIISNYLKELSRKREIDYSMIYFDTDSRKIVDIGIHEKSFSEHKKEIYVDWNLEDRLSIYGAELVEYTTVLTSSINYFENSENQFEELFSELLTSIDLRAFFTSYDNIKSVVNERNKFEDSMFSNYIESEIERFIISIFGIMPHHRDKITIAKKNITETLNKFYNEFASSNFFSTPVYTSKYKTLINKISKSLTKNLQNEVLDILEKEAENDENLEIIKSNVPIYIEILYENIMKKAKVITNLKQIDFSTSTFNKFKKKYIKDIEKSQTLNNRALISIVFEKIVSFAVFSAIKKNEILSDTISGVFQNVKLDGKSGSLIEIDNLILFKNGYIHIFEAKTSHVYNKDINSKIMVLKKYLGENIKMDIVFPFTFLDIELLQEKNRKFIKSAHKSGFKHINSWLNFFHSTDKSITCVDKIEQRLIDIALKYSE